MSNYRSGDNSNVLRDDVEEAKGTCGPVIDVIRTRVSSHASLPHCVALVLIAQLRRQAR